MGTSSRWRGRSMPGRTRSSAMWWPSGCSACRGAERGVDFAFSEEQEELRQGVRDVLDVECPGHAARLRLADRASRAGPAVDRWTVLAELGATGAVRPRVRGGTGAERRRSRRGVGRGGAGLSTGAAIGDGRGRCTDARHAAARARRRLRPPLTGRATPASPSVASTSPRAGRCRRPPSRPRDIPHPTRRRRPRRRLLLLAVRTPTGLAASRRARSVVHSLRHAGAKLVARLSTVRWPLAPETLLAYGVAAEAAIGLLADRAAAGNAALLIGLADRMLTKARPTPRSATSSASRSAAFRRSSTCWPTPASSSSSPARPPTAPPGRSPRPSPPCRTTRRWPRPWPRTPPTCPPGWPCRSTGPSATRGSATSTSSSSGRGPSHGPGRRRHPPPARAGPAAEGLTRRRRDAVRREPAASRGIGTPGACTRASTRPAVNRADDPPGPSPVCAARSLR